MLKLLALTMLLLFPIGVWAQEKQEPTLAPPYDAIVDITNWVGTGANVYNPNGSGTLVHVSGGKGYVLTCDHIFHKTHADKTGNEVYVGRAEGRVEAVFPGGHKSYGRVIDYRGEPMDVALVEIDQAPPNVAPVKLATIKQDEGPFTIIGWGSNGTRLGRRIRWRQGPFAKWHDDRRVAIGIPALKGSSGGPLLNKHGEQVGVLTSTTNKTSTHAAGPELISFVEKAVQK